MRSRARTCLTAVVLLLVPACGEQPTERSPDTVAAPSPPQRTLERVEWQLVEVVVGGVVRDVRALDARLRLDGRGGLGTDGCNLTGNRVTVAGDRLHVTEGTTTLVGCTGEPAEVDAAVAAVLRATPRWELDDAGLRLTADDGTALRYEERVSPWRLPEAPTLLEGAVGEAVYRLSWTAEGSGAGVDLESRQAPGQPTGSAGVSLAVDEAVMPWFPLTVRVGPDAALLAVPLRPEVVRAVAQHPSGDVELAPFDLPGEPGWRVWAALLPHAAPGTVVVGWAADGTELGRSRELPDL